MKSLTSGSVFVACFSACSVMVANPRIRSSWKATTYLLDLFFREEKVRKGEKEVEHIRKTESYGGENKS